MIFTNITIFKNAKLSRVVLSYLLFGVTRWDNTLCLPTHTMFEFGPRPTYASTSSFSTPAEMIIIIIIIVMRGPAKIIIIICDWPPATMICYKKVIYNIGTKILMLTSNLHNSTLRGRTEMLVYDPESSDRVLSFELGPRAVAAIF